MLEDRGELDEGGFPTVAVMIAAHDEALASLLDALEPLPHALRGARSFGEALSFGGEPDVGCGVVDLDSPFGADAARALHAARPGLPLVLVFDAPPDHAPLDGCDLAARRLAPELLRLRVGLYASRHRRGEELKRRARLLHARDLFLGILGHDLRNPIQALKTGIGLVDMNPSRELQGPVLGRMRRSLDRMERMVRDLLDFTRAHLAGGITLSLGRCDLAAICQQVVDEARMAYPERAIRVALDGDLTGLWDGPRVAQALANLVVNALEHGHREVTIVGGEEGAAVRVAVHNDGPPIPPERQGSLFEPFHPSRRSLGLGLYIVREIARIHGADLEVRSSVDDGTTFALRLPRVPPHHPRGEPRLFEA